MTYELKITFDSDTKNVEVNGPTDDLALCLLMLDLGRQSVLQFKMAQVGERRVLPANGFPVPKVPTQ